MGNPLAALGLASAAMLVLVAVVAFMVLPGPFIAGTAPVWIAPAGDAAQHAVGGWYFLADSWRMPLLMVPQLGVPGGSNIALTDSIPLVAMVAKLLRGVFGTDYVYLGPWLLLCFLLQGPAAATVLYICGVRRALPLLLGGLLMLGSPVLLARLGHAALCGQFLVLLALALHLDLTRRCRLAAFLLYVPLLAAALLTHVYLFAMVAALFGASLLDGLWTDRLAARTAIGLIGVVAVPLAGVLWTCGYLGLGPIPIKPYGEWAFDLATPVLPSFSLLFAVDGMPLGLNFETLAWVGAGQAALLLVAAIAWRRDLAGVLARHSATVIVCTSLVVFAASYAVHVAGQVVLGIDPARVRAAVLGAADANGALLALRSGLDGGDMLRLVGLLILLGGLAAWGLGRAVVLGRWRALRVVGIVGAVLLLVGVLQPRALLVGVSTFQASARLVWVPLYLLALLAIVGVCRRFAPRVATTVLAAALLVQAIDTWPLWRSLLEHAHSRGRLAEHDGGLAGAIAAAEDVRVVPTYLCAHARPAELRAGLIARISDVQVLAARANRPIDSVRSSRMTAADGPALVAKCEADLREVVGDMARPGRLTIISTDTPEAVGLAGCREAPGWVYCLAPQK